MNFCSNVPNIDLNPFETMYFDVVPKIGSWNKTAQSIGTKWKYVLYALEHWNKTGAIIFCGCFRSQNSTPAKSGSASSFLQNKVALRLAWHHCITKKSQFQTHSELFTVCIFKRIREPSKRKELEFDTSSHHQIQALLNQGMSLEEIKFQIKKHLINFDFQNTYLEYSGEFVHGEYQTNEQELYLHPVSDPYAIYNVPYIEDFEKLKKSAKLFTNEDIFKAYINIFEARGFDFATAQNLACLALRQTDIINPKEWT